jgi:hypothetical protein
MHHSPPRPPRGRNSLLRVVPVAAVMLATAVPCATAGAQALATAVHVVGDSVIVINPPFGNATVQVTRPDAVTGKPVVIGQYSGLNNSPGPFTVNTTTPTALSPDGDCWQAGALSQALTPDIRPGDTVTFTSQQGQPGGGASSMSVTVPADGPGGADGPIPSCRDSAPFAQNAVTTGPQTVSGGPIDVSGVAQPLATGISSTITDGAGSTSPVDVAPNADGSWSATVPAAQVGALANGSLAVNPVFAVPDVSTGAPAHIEGARISIQKSSAGGAAAGPASKATQPGAQQGASASVIRRVSKLSVPARISLAGAQRTGLRASFVVPDGARVVAVRLSTGKHTVLRSVVSAGKAGTRQTVRLSGAALRRVLRRGRYTLAVSAGPSRTSLGTPVTRTISVR